MMSPKFPMLRADARLRIADQSVEVDIDDCIFTVSGPPPSRLLQAIASMNGLQDLDVVGRQSGLHIDTIRSTVKCLTDIGVLRHGQSAPRECLSPDEFSRLCRRLYGQWKQRLFSHPLWVGLADGSLPRPVFVGWVVESWWFIEGVIDRLPMAIANTEDPAIRAVFSQHFAEEWDHFTFFERALDALGITANMRANARPLPSTQAVQNLTRSAARRDPLRYAACSGFLESTGTDRTAARLFFDLVGKCYDGTERRAVRPMMDHVTLDEKYGHGGFVEKVVNEIQEIEWERAHAAIRDAYALVETLEMWSTDILRHYQSPDAFPLSSARAYRGANK